MKLRPLFLLCFHCLLCSSVSLPDIDVDCDDPNIFKAVDEALTSYNNAREDGKQFVLYKVTDAKERNDADGEIYYFIGYEIHEGTCILKSKNNWQDCQFQAIKPEWGKCSAHLHVNNERTIQTVVSQNCSISKVPLESHVSVVHHQCLGCPHPINPNNEEILYFLEIAIEKMNQEGNHLYYFDLDRIVNATRQVVNGWDYNIYYEVRQTNCSKMKYKAKDSNICKFDREGEIGECHLHVSETTDGRLNEIFLTCTSQAGVCISCPQKVDPDDSELHNLLSQVIDEYNSNINVTKLHKLSKVIKATKHGFHGHIYDVLFIMRPTNCSKPDYTILGEECENVENAYPLSCDTIFNVTDKRIHVHSAPACIEQQSIFLKGLKGLSPLRRSFGTPDQKRESLHLFIPQTKQKRSRGNKKEHKQEQKGKSHKKPHKEHKHGHDNESSSEEVESGSNDNKKEVTTSSPQVPDLSTAQPNISIKHPTSGTEETSKLPSVSKCPGKLWKPKSLTTTVDTFSEDDLASAAADIKPLQDREEKDSKPYTPKQITLLDDEDLLL